ncbi:c-type cytochrome [Alcaligenes faecalis]|uniref:c-type cytochrome n=1 Tax=Alcaligenes faecalis TaxID=511 RepID=UPI0005A66ABC|nr:c-type cytochrome [Alcaligenes faecalis]MCX5596446.1 c-type cytochrome [Alcaligenes faecalis]QQC33521.1 cytochrome c4 [Alcaligenes faecalis]CAJ0910869.1 Cytochrome c4 [Alcaligenes faecalis subsp. faecalis]CUJ02324.1 Cytochrome c4 [Alcaligenes faecalis]GAU75389.1 cytochrome C [Alcaligenes faecalis subsp. faecalis NBRC 13111]
MKRALSRVVIASSLTMACSVVFTANVANAAGLPKPDAAKGEQLYLQGEMSRGVLACVTCHGDGGNSIIPVNPSLAHQPYEYLVKQLHDFRAKDEKSLPSRRGPEGANSLMAAIAAGMTEEDMQNVAFYLSQQAVNWEQAANATKEDTMERGQKIWRGGLPERGVAACAACHSPDGAGMPGQFPRLAGQHPAYIAEQLKLFRSGDRANGPMMHDIADRMSDADIAAVSDFAAGLR